MDFRVLTEPQQGATYEDLLAVARRAEDAGFGAFFRSDHLLATGGESLPGPTDAWTTLAGLSRETSRIRLGTLVSPATFRQPGLLAVQAAQVDQMSGGRVELGLGAAAPRAQHRSPGGAHRNPRSGRAVDDRLDPGAPPTAPHVGGGGRGRSAPAGRGVALRGPGHGGTRRPRRLAAGP